MCVVTRCCSGEWIVIWVEMNGGKEGWWQRTEVAKCIV